MVPRALGECQIRGHGPPLPQRHPGVPVRGHRVWAAFPPSTAFAAGRALGDVLATPLSSGYRGPGAPTPQICPMFGVQPHFLCGDSGKLGILSRPPCLDAALV